MIKGLDPCMKRFLSRPTISSFFESERGKNGVPNGDKAKKVFEITNIPETHDKFVRVFNWTESPYSSSLP